MAQRMRSVGVYNTCILWYSIWNALCEILLSSLKVLVFPRARENAAYFWISQKLESFFIEDKICMANKNKASDQLTHTIFLGSQTLVRVYIHFFLLRVRIQWITSTFTFTHTHRIDICWVINLPLQCELVSLLICGDAWFLQKRAKDWKRIRRITLNKYGFELISFFSCGIKITMKKDKKHQRREELKISLNWLMVDSSYCCCFCVGRTKELQTFRLGAIFFIY